MDWNPNRPKVIGPEFAPKSAMPGPGYRIDAPFRSAIQRLKSTATETIHALSATLVLDPGTDPLLLGEVLIADDAIPLPVTTTVFRPTEVVMASGDAYIDGDLRTQNVGTQTGSLLPADILAVIERSNPTADQHVGAGVNPTDSLKYGLLATQFDTDGVLDGERIVDVRVVMTGFGIKPFVGVGRGLGLPIQSDDYFGPPAPFPSDPLGPPHTPAGPVGAVSIIDNGATLANVVILSPSTTADQPTNDFASGIPLVTTLGEMIPTSNLTQPNARPWLTSDLDALDATTGSRSLLVYINPGNSTGRSLAITSLYIEVDHVTENRLSADLVRTGDMVTGKRPVTWTPHKPDGTANLTKTNGQDLAVVLRRPYYGQFGAYGPPGQPGSMYPTRNPGDLTWAVPYIQAFKADTAPVGLEGYPDAILNANGTVGSLGEPSTDRIIGMDLRVVTTDAQSVDSEPWDTIIPIPVSGTVEQEVTTTTAATYDGVQFVVKFTPLSLGNLTITLKRRSDDATMGTATLTALAARAVTEDPADGWRLVQVPFSAPAALAATTQYYLSFTAAGPGGWVIAALSPDPVLADLTGNNTATYDGNTDVATFPGYSSSLQGYTDVAAFVYDAPEYPAAFGVSLVADPAPAPPQRSDGHPAIRAINRVVITWDAIPDSSNIVEIQRANRPSPVGGFPGPYDTIYLIAGVYTEIYDWEARIGVQNVYRARVIDPLTGIASGWSPTAGVVPLDWGCGYTFTSNADPFGNCAYTDVHDGGFADREYTFPAAAERIFRTVYERPYQVGFRPPQTRGVQFTRTLLLADGTEAAWPYGGPASASPLTALSASQFAPYICVLDESGNRFFASLDVPSMLGRRPGTLQYADVVVTETTATPAIQTEPMFPPIFIGPIP